MAAKKKHQKKKTVHKKKSHAKSGGFATKSAVNKLGSRVTHIEHYLKKASAA